LLNRPECRSFREGLQIIITTDRAAATFTGLAPDPAQRWLILRAEGFGGGVGTQAEAGVAAAAATGDGRSRVGELLHLPMRPWLVIESADQVPSQLRGAWSEALHGS
jgi:hypothetical protein